MIFFFVAFYVLCVPVFWAASWVRPYVIILLVAFSAIYDLIDYSVLYLGVSGGSKLLPEIILLGFVGLYFLQKTPITVRFAKQLILLTLCFLLPLALLAVNESTLIAQLSELRLIFRTIFLYLFVRETCYFSANQFKRVLYGVGVSAFAIVLAGIYQHATYDGDYSSVWRYQPLLEAKTERNEDFLERFMFYQIVRGDDLRASGTFYSALNYGYLVGLFGVVSAIKLLETNGIRGKISWLVMFSVCLYGVYCSNVRTAAILVPYGLIVNFLVARYGASTRTNFWILGLSYALVYSSILAFENLLDASTASRVDQIYRVVSDFSIMGTGFGARFDSAHLFLINSFGILSPIAFWGIVSFFLPKELTDRALARAEARILYVCAICILFIMPFQFTFGSYVYNVFLLVLASYLATLNFENRESPRLRVVTRSGV